MCMKFIFFAIIILCCITGCSTKLEKLITDNISEIREYVLFAKNEDVSVSFMCGERESDYKMNGVTSELIPFGVITVTNISETFQSSDISYVLYVGTQKYEGLLEKNPFDGTLVSDIKENVDKSNNISITLSNGKDTTSLKLKNVEYFKINTSDCVDILLTKYKEELNKFVVDNNFQGEVYIKIIDDYDAYTSMFYYYVSVVGVDGNYINLLISPSNGEILASNINIKQG